MKLLKSGILGIFISCMLFCHEGISQSDPCRYEYSSILLDSTHAKQENVKMARYIHKLQSKLAKKMDVVIGYCPATLASYPPESPLSNLITDAIYDFGNTYLLDKKGLPADFSLLNFGGIRNIIPAGEVTIGTIFKILPFDNTIVICSLKGKEVKKLFERFTPEKSQPYSNVQLTYQDQKVSQILIRHQEIEDERVYNLVTISFIAEGGDQILNEIKIDETLLTNILIRDVVINAIKKNDKNIKKEIDQRAIIK